MKVPRSVVVPTGQGSCAALHGRLLAATWKSARSCQTGTAVHAKLTIPADVARTYRQANIKLFLV